MPDHLHPEIEPRLRAAAEARRRAAGGPFALHPADRRRLQDEVARTFGQAVRETRPGWLAWLRRHRAGLAFYSALALVIMVCVPTMLIPALGKKRTGTAPAATTEARPAAPRPMAQVQPEVATAPLRPDAPAPSAPALPAEVADRGATEFAYSAPAVAPRLAMRAGQADAAALALSDSTRLDSDARRGGTSIASVAGTTSTVASRQPTSPLLAPSASALPPASEPLSRFQLERRGSLVTVRDADGSVYHGALLAETVPERLETPTVRGLEGAAGDRAADGLGAEARARFQRRYSRPAPAPAAPPAPVQAMNFRVLGTNRTSQQAVLFQGSLAWPADQLSATQTWVRSLAPAHAKASATLPTGAPPGAAGTNATLVGELQVGPTPPVRLEARPAHR